MIGHLKQCFQWVGLLRPDPVLQAPPTPPPEQLPPPEENTEEQPVLTPDQRQTVEDIVSVFETGSPSPDYGAVTVLKDGAGITYGKHQATDHSDTLDAILFRYMDLGGQYGDQIEPFLARLEADSTAHVDPDDLPAWVDELCILLELAGKTDPIMRQAQDQVFDEMYWQPAASQSEAMQLVLPLSWLVVYDSTIHSGPQGVGIIRKLFPEVPPSRGGDEMAWAEAYLNARKGWLLSRANPVIHRTVYRVEAMLDLIEKGNWSLSRPIYFKRPPVVLS